MKTAMFVLGLLTLPLVAGVAVSHVNLPCPLRIVTVLTGDGATAGVTQYWVDDDGDGDPSGDDWLFIESGAKPGVQTGANHVALGATWGHNHKCGEATASLRDHEYY